MRLSPPSPLRAATSPRRGSLAGGWLVLDFFDVIVHVMRADMRARYDLEGLWGDAPRVRVRKAKAPAEE